MREPKLENKAPKFKTQGELVRDHIKKLKEKGAICCSLCGLPSGLNNVILRKSKDVKGKYFCAKGCPKVPK